MNKWISAILLLVFIYLVATIFSMFIFDKEDGFGDRIVIVPIKGVITTEVGSDLFGGGSSISSNELVRDIEALDKDSSVKGIIFEIDSPGGTAVASQEIANAIGRLNKTNYALIREVGASGAYWVASASDKIIASPVSITGSIGVIASYLQFSELFEKYGVTYERLVAGNSKDIGSSFRELTDNERELLQRKIDLMHLFFIKEVAKNRNLDENYVKNISTGEFYLGSEALDLGLVDVLGDRKLAVELMEEELGVSGLNIVERKYEKRLIDIVLGRTAYDFGRGFARELSKIEVENGLEIRA